MSRLLCLVADDLNFHVSLHRFSISKNKHTVKSEQDRTSLTDKENQLFSLHLQLLPLMLNFNFYIFRIAFCSINRVCEYKEKLNPSSAT